MNEVLTYARVYPQDSPSKQLMVLFFSKEGVYTDKKDNKIFLIFKEIQSGAVANSYMRKGFLIYEEMHKYFPI